VSPSFSYDAMGVLEVEHLTWMRLEMCVSLRVLLHLTSG
jgi:hypothetical protein